jgi:hypothetical protein
VRYVFSSHAETDSGSPHISQNLDLTRKTRPFSLQIEVGTKNHDCRCYGTMGEGGTQSRESSKFPSECSGQQDTCCMVVPQSVADVEDARHSKGRGHPTCRRGFFHCEAYGQPTSLLPSSTPHDPVSFPPVRCGDERGTSPYRGGSPSCNSDGIPSSTDPPSVCRNGTGGESTSESPCPAPAIPPLPD